MDKVKKGAIVSEYAVHSNDTGSSEVQVALLTARISRLADHLRTHIHDQHSRRGLLKLIGQRKALLAYINGQDINRYRSLIGKLGLRK